MEDAFHIRERSMVSHGTFQECFVCKRKLLVEVFIFEPRTMPTVKVTCRECLEIPERFRRERPEDAARIEAWKNEGQPQPKG